MNEKTSSNKISLIVIVLIIVTITTCATFVLVNNKTNYGENNSMFDSKNIKEISVRDGGSAIILTNTGELGYLLFSGTHEKYTKYNDKNVKLIASGVSEFTGDYYLTTKNDLYDYDWRNPIGSSSIIAHNVKEFEGPYFLTTTNELYYYDDGTTTLAAKNVKEIPGYYDNYYLSTSGELVTFVSYLDRKLSKKSNIPEKVIASNVKANYDYGQYINEQNELYIYNKENGETKKIADNIKKYYNQHYRYDYYITNNDELKYYDEETGITKTIDNEVKEFGGGKTYLTKSNQIKLYNMEDGSIKTIAENVKKYYGTSYINFDNELKEYSEKDGQSKKISDNVKEYYYGSFLTNLNELYDIDYFTKQPQLIAKNIRRVHPRGEDWYETDSGEIYLIYDEPVTFD